MVCLLAVDVCIQLQALLSLAHQLVWTSSLVFNKTGYIDCKCGCTLTHYFLSIEEGPPNCVFSQLNPDDKPRVANYLDGYKDNKGKVYQAGTVAEITARINEMWQKCGKYVLIMNNCEHLATYVRYGVKLALQVCG